MANKRDKITDFVEINEWWILAVVMIVLSFIAGKLLWYE